MKNVNWVICILLFSGFVKLNAQVPPRDQFIFAFENNFENNQLGNYLLSDWRSDWSQSSYATLPSTVDIDIVSENSSKYMRGNLDGGKYQPANHGWCWNTKLKQEYKELYISYDVRFKPGYEWVLGGKMPFGMSGGPIASGASPTETSGWTVRTMWKEQGQLVFYVYHQDRAIQFGSTWPWGTFKFTSGKWYNLTIRVVVNTFSNGVAQSNGILEGFIDGKLLFQKSGIKYRSVESYDVDNLIQAAFFGGNTAEWASARDEWIDTDNYVAYYYSNTASNVTRGNTLSPSGTLLLHPYRNFGSGTTATSLAAPSALTSTASTSNSISLKWTDNTTAESGFKIECRKDSESAFTEITSVGANVMSFTHQNLAAGNIYHYRVRAFNSSGTSAYSNILDAVTTSTSTSTSSNSTSNLLAHFKYEKSVSDLSNNGNDGTLVNGAGYSSTLFKEGKNSLLLDGTNDYVNLGSVNLENLFTFASWVYIPSGSSNIRTIISNAPSGARSNGFKIMVNSYGTTDRSIVVETGNGTATGTTKTNPSVFMFDRWNHIVVTIDRSNLKSRIFLNGTDVTASSNVASGFNMTNNIFLGIMSNLIYPMKGNLDDTRIYNKLLSESEIQGLVKLTSLKNTTETQGSIAISMDSQVDVTVYPNPFIEQFTIRSSGLIKSVEIYDIGGAIVYQEKSIDQNSYMIEDFPGNQSVYLLKVHMATGEFQTIKILKN